MRLVHPAHDLVQYLFVLRVRGHKRLYLGSQILAKLRLLAHRWNPSVYETPPTNDNAAPQINPEAQRHGMQCRGGSQTALLAGEKPRRIPHQDDAAARRVLRHADQLPALARSLVDRRLQCRLRRASLAGVQRSVLRVVALGLRPVRVPSVPQSCPSSVLVVAPRANLST